MDFHAESESNVVADLPSIRRHDTFQRPPLFIIYTLHMIYTETFPQPYHHLPEEKEVVVRFRL